MNYEKKILQSWEKNANSWCDTIASGQLESRILVTNQAIINAILQHNPKRVLDIGCGEGWLCQELSIHQIDIVGVDAIPLLIEKAKQKNKGQYQVATYESIYNNEFIFDQTFDVIVINFALIGEESVEKLIPSLQKYLSESGKLIIQTLHPHNRKAINDYISGWKSESWDGLGDQYTMPYLWYFRTIEDWEKLFDKSGYHLRIIETIHPKTFAFASIIFECTPKNK